MQARKVAAELIVRIRVLLTPILDGFGLFGDLELQGLEVGDLHRVLARAVDVPNDECERERDPDISSKRDVSGGSHFGT